MAGVVEVSLRVPNMKVRALDENGYPIDHSAVRFKRLVSVEVIPKPGDPLLLTTLSGRTLESTVVRSDWHEDKALFVVACQYANRSISAEDYGALVNDPDWEMKPLI
jgi:hypothetical protein